MGTHPIEIERRTGAIKRNPIYECLWNLYCNKGPKAMLFSDLIACVSLEAFDGRMEPFSELIHFIRPHKGQITAKRIQEFLEGSEIIAQEIHVQDPYSLDAYPGSWSF
jgi:histidine ammonia-lyase